MDQLRELLSLPITTLSLLAAGYLSYRLAYIGKDTQHKTIDVIFLVFVYAFVARLSAGMVGAALMKTTLSPPVVQVGASLSGMMIALCVAAYWRKWGESQTFERLRYFNISFSDRHLSAWETVISKPGIEYNSLIIRKTDGSVLKSENLGQFNGLPFGDTVLGNDGSVAMYVTHFKGAGISEWSERDPSAYLDWGEKITIVPASAISEIDLRARKEPPR
ncbi:MAG: hypothetical protein COA78_38295 [Blastopirellula sp.]|nr:MAG: hypothetical protein COA78_38295 [Blastopirellula sp.]